VPTTDDKLLQQLIGKKAAKAHLESRQASKNSAKQSGQKHVKTPAVPQKVESEDEEEGRASAFKSKKRKIVKTRPLELTVADSETRGHTVDGVPFMIPHYNASKESDGQTAGSGSDAEIQTKGTLKARHRSSNPASYLDQLLAERSKKKKKKFKSTVDA
jgi:hypothetical protein